MVCRMNSRMDKYNDDYKSMPSRSDKNKELYQSINKSQISDFKSYSNYKVIDESAKEIDLNKIKTYVEALNREENVRNRRSLIENKGLYKTEKLEEEEKTKDYDINTILEKAREKREKDYEEEKYKKLRDTQFDILSKLKIADSTPKEEIEEFNTEEKTLIDLINTVADNKSKNELLSELEEEVKEIKDENKELTEKLEEEKIKNIVTEQLTQELQKKQIQIEEEKEDNRKVDDTFFTNSLTFSKDDFEEEQSSCFKAKFGIFILVVLIIFAVYVLLYFVLDVNDHQRHSQASRFSKSLHRPTL